MTAQFASTLPSSAMTPPPGTVRAATFSGVEATPTADSLDAPTPLLGVPFDHITRAKLKAVVAQMIESGRPHYLATADAGLLLRTRKDAQLRQILFDTHLLICDGPLLEFVSRSLGNTLIGEISGAKLLPVLLEIAEESQYRIFVLGESETATGLLTEKIRRTHPQLDIGKHHYSPTSTRERDREEVHFRIQEFKPDLLIVAFGCPEQERWISAHYRCLGVPICIGAGSPADPTSRSQHPNFLHSTWSFVREPSRTIRRAIDALAFGCDLAGQFWRLLKQTDDLPPSAALAAQESEDRSVLIVPERLDAAAVEESRSEWETLLDSGKPVVIDLALTKFIDSTGVGFLMKLRRLSREKETAFALAAVQPSVWRTITSMKLADFFPTGDTVKTASEAARQPQRRSLWLRETPSGIALHLQGEISTSNSEQAFDSCAELLKGVHLDEAAEVDLTRVTFLDRTGIAVLMRLRKLALRLGIRLKITNPNPAVSTTLRNAGLTEYLLREASPPAA